MNPRTRDRRHTSAAHRSTIQHLPASLSHPDARDAVNDAIQTPQRAHNVDPLWMITTAGALLFVFLALAAVFS